MFGNPILYDLKENGEQIPVTKDNREVKMCDFLYAFLVYTHTQFEVSTSLCSFISQLKLTTSVEVLVFFPNELKWK